MAWFTSVVSAPRTTSSAVLPLVGVLLLGLASGCSDDDEGAPAASAPATTTSASPTTATPSATPSPRRSVAPVVRPSRVPRATSPAQQVPSGAGVTVVLSAGGLGFVTDEGRRQVPFGSTVSQLTPSLAATLGAGETRSLPECGQGPRKQVEYDGFTILLEGTRFVGWTESGSAERDLMTDDGIALQVTLSEVREAQPDVEVLSASLGPEFVSETGVSGFLDGTRPQSRVNLLGQ